MISGIPTLFLYLEYVGLVWRGWRSTQKMRYQGMQLTGGEDCNAGYLVFESLQDLEDHKEADRLASEIYRGFRYTFSLKTLGVDKFRKIHNILKEGGVLE